MRKFAIVLLAVVLVLGMSSGVMAELKSESIDANIKINQYVDLNIGEAEDSKGDAFDGTPEIDIEEYGKDPGGDGMNNEYAIYWPVDIRSNDDIGVLLEEDISNKIEDQNSETIKVWPYTGDENPDMTVNLSLYNEHNREQNTENTEMPDEPNGNRYVGPEKLNSGVNDWTLGLNATVTDEGMDKIDPETYEGTVTLTVYGE